VVAVLMLVVVKVEVEVMEIEIVELVEYSCRNSSKIDEYEYKEKD
jgi:hypothetical protein